MSFFDWEIEQAKTNGINDCPFCDGLCVMSQIGNEHTKKLCLEIECTNCHVKRKQCILNSSGVLSIDKLKEMMTNDWNSRTKVIT